MGETRREGERKRTLATGADEPERHRASRRLYSARSVTPAKLHFVNASAKTIVFFYWVDWDCHEVFYGSLLPDTEADQDTFVGHVWRLRSAETGALLRQHVAAGSESVTVEGP